MTQPIFITGIGTGIGKTIVSAIVTEALQADYWKPIQAGFDDGTDAQSVGDLVSNSRTVIHPEVYKLRMPASPHIAAASEGITIDLQQVADACKQLPTTNPYVVVEGAGGLLVPLNTHQFIADLVVALQATCILVSRNYLGSINHSLLTAAECKRRNIKTAGWIFNDQYLDYETDIVTWSGIPAIASIPNLPNLSRQAITLLAAQFRQPLLQALQAAV